MDPTPAIHISLILACFLVVWRVGRSAKTIRQGVVKGGITAALCGLLSPPIILGLLMGSDWKDPIWVLITMAVIGGIMASVTVLMATPVGALLGAITVECRTLIHNRRGNREAVESELVSGGSNTAGNVNRLRRIIGLCLLTLGFIIAAEDLLYGPHYWSVISSEERLSIVFWLWISVVLALVGCWLAARLRVARWALVVMVPLLAAVLYSYGRWWS
jgi:hypothetical protein